MRTAVSAVTIDQQVYCVPSLRVDPRGIVMGEQVALRFGILPQVVGFFQAYSRSHSLDPLASSLKILRTRSRTAGSAFLVTFAVQGSYQLDTAARLAGLLGGDAFTGTWPHFVMARDRHSPLGYDATQLEHSDSGPVLYTKVGPVPLTVQQEVELGAVARKLSLQRVVRRRRGKNEARASDEAAGRALVRVPVGLRRAMQSLLVQRGVAASLALVEPSGGHRGPGWYLFEITSLSVRVAGLISTIPGVEVYVSRIEHPVHIYVQLGWKHPLALENCAAFFDARDATFFSGTRGVVDVVDATTLRFEPLAELTTYDVDLELLGEERTEVRSRARHPLEATPFEVRLVPSHALPRGGGAGLATAILIREARELTWLKKLIHALPGPMLSGYQMAVTSDGVFVTHARGVEWLPVGLPMWELHPRFYIPVGTRLSPAVSGAQLERAVGLDSEHVYVVEAGLRRVIAIPRDALRPLTRHLLEHLVLDPARDLVPQDEVPQQPSLRSAPTSRFSLWIDNILKPSITQKPRALTGDSE